MAVIELTADNFEQEVLKAEGKVFVDFWATWCGPCQMMGPVVDELAEERSDVKFGKVNVDEQMELARKYRVMSIPTFLVYQNGEVVGRTMGGQTKEELAEVLDK
ncbi:thioredoxin [Roseburia hominis]